MTPALTVAEAARPITKTRLLRERVADGGRTIRRFILYPGPVNDGTCRCIGCGQVDEDGWHDRDLHVAVVNFLIRTRPTGEAK